MLKFVSKKYFPANPSPLLPLQKHLMSSGVFEVFTYRLKKTEGGGGYKHKFTIL